MTTIQTPGGGVGSGITSSPTAAVEHGNASPSGPLDPHVRALADAACRRLGLSPWEVLHKPRILARIAAQDALMAQVRADAMRVQGKRPRDARGRFTP